LVGRTEAHVCLRAGPWSLHLAVDREGRFPDADAVVPRANGAVTVCALSPQDAAFLAQALPRLPGAGDHGAVTLDLNGQAAVRAPATTTCASAPPAAARRARRRPCPSLNPRPSPSPSKKGGVPCPGPKNPTTAGRPTATSTAAASTS